MGRCPTTVASIVLGSLVLASVACDATSPGDGDVDGDVPDREVETDTGDSEADAEAHDDGGRGQGGPVSGLVASVEVLTDRLCDIDGDGSLDNSIADLGTPSSGLLAMAISATLEGAIEQGSRLGCHIPWVDDVETPHDLNARMAALFVLDGDSPPNPDDDFSGDDTFHAAPGALDGCGEPLYVFPEVPITNGAIISSGGELPLPLGSSAVVCRVAHAEGIIHRGSTGAEITMCASLSASELGAVNDVELESVSALELFLGGGASFGIPSVPGITPDVDVDGDGLERFVLDSDGRITSCVDGDMSVIEGNDCWQDERIADSFSLIFRIGMIAGRFVGPLPGWQWAVAEPCDPLDRGESFWDPCGPGSPDACDFWESRECEPVCGGGGVERCGWGCEWSDCEPGGVDRWALAAGDEILIEGESSCSGDPPVVELLGGEAQQAGFHALREVEVGRGPLSIEARIRATAVSPWLPGYGWGLAAFIASDELWIGDSIAAIGANVSRRGYSAGWVASAVEDPGDLPDHLVIEMLDGSGIRGPHSFIGNHGVPSAESSLDEATEGEVTQQLRLVIEPDLPETEENEMVVLGQAFDGERYAFVSQLSCFGAGCSVTIVAGDVLHVGITSASRPGEAARYALDLDGESFVIEARGLCP